MVGIFGKTLKKFALERLGIKLCCFLNFEEVVEQYLTN